MILGEKILVTKGCMNICSIIINIQMPLNGPQINPGLNKIGEF